MRIIEIVPTLEDEASGPAYSVPRLAEALAEQGNDVHLLSVGDQAPGVRVSVRQSRYAQDLRNVPFAHRLFLSRALNASLVELVGGVDIVHSHGLWVMPNIYPAWAAARAGKPLLISPRGTLGAVPLTYSANIKKAFWYLMQGSAARAARCIHATSEDEYRDIRKFGLSQPVAVIPNGIDIAPLKREGARDGGPRRLLYLGRLHQKKGIESLLTAWSAVSSRFPDWELRLVGGGPEAYSESLRQLSHKLGLQRVTFAGPRYAEMKAEEYADADLFILPSFNENFGMTVAEALAQGVPVIASKGTPWSGIVENDCGWWIETGASTIQGSLEQALALDREELARRGAKGREWMTREFSWQRVARDMSEVYRWVVQGGPVPPFVRMD